MARSWLIHVVVLVIFLAATVDYARTSGSKATPKKTTQQPVVTTTKTEACGDRWKKYGKSYFSFCPCPRPCVINTARKKCEKKQATLAKCTSTAMNNFFIREVKKAFIILGGTDRVTEGVWRWPDGSLLNESYTRWHSGEPDGGRGENCLVMFRGWGVWFDKNCGYPLFWSAGFVCEKKRL